MLILTPQAMSYFLGSPVLKHPVITIKQQLSGRLIEIKDIQPITDKHGCARRGLHLDLEI